jgi:hypothetical protein
MKPTPILMAASFTGSSGNESYRSKTCVVKVIDHAGFFIQHIPFA